MLLHFKASYIRAKRDNQTIFLYFEPTDTVKHIVEKLAKIVSKPAEDVRFVLNNNPVDESKTCMSANLVSDSVVHFTYRQGMKLGKISETNGCTGGDWEAVKVPQVETD